MKRSFWKNKNVLVTGYEGFLGSNLTQRLIKLGTKTVGLDIKTRRNSTILTNSDYRRIKVIQGDVRDYRLLNKIIQGYKIQIVFHLAAEAIVGECLKNPLGVFSSNIQGTWNILECCRGNKRIKAIIVASSDKAYGSHKNLPYQEATPLCGDRPYDVSKSCADLITNTYYRTFRLPVSITRCGNIYGPGDFNFSRLIPGAVKSALKKEEFQIRSNGRYTRDYIYVDDVVSAYLLLAENLPKKKIFGQAFNFSNEKPCTVIEVVKKIYAIASARPKYKILDQVRHEIKDQYLTSAKAKKILGWQPRYSLDSGLKQTVKAYEQYFCKRR